jgi:hypothetical protein
VLRHASRFAAMISLFPAVFLPLMAALSRRRQAATAQDDRMTPLPPASRRGF